MTSTAITGAISGDPVVILGAARTPMGDFQGAFAGTPTPTLGAAAIRAAVARSGLNPALVDQAYMGCVLPAGLGQAPARQAALGGGLPESAGCTTVSKVCGSGMMAAMFGHDALLAGSAEVVVAGGMECMSNAPYLLDRARAGYRMGHGRVIDHMFLDGLEDAYEPGRLMGTYAEACAEAYGFSRADQDAYAETSLIRAKRAVTEGLFVEEIAPVTLSTRKGDIVVDRDEAALKASVDKIATLKPAFAKNGTVTAANAASISDGAAALVLARRSLAEREGATPLATLVATANFAHHRDGFTTAPIHAIRRVVDKAGWQVGEVDLFEINEAFAVVAMAAMRDLDIPHDKVNIHGGACALGHPIGASGARIIVTLVAALKRYGLKRGVACLCLGGGEATAVAVEI